MGGDRIAPSSEQISRWLVAWGEQALATEPADRDRFEHGLRTLYALSGLPDPERVVWVASPLVAALAGPIAGAMAGPLVTLLDELRAIYRQFVRIDERHLEVVVKRLLGWVTVEDPGDTSFFTGELVGRAAFAEENGAVEARGGLAAEGLAPSWGCRSRACSLGDGPPFSPRELGHRPERLEPSDEVLDDVPAAGWGRPDLGQKPSITLLVTADQAAGSPMPKHGGDGADAARRPRLPDACGTRRGPAQCRGPRQVRGQRRRGLRRRSANPHQPAGPCPVR